ncbi:MAG: alginate lyase family protein [Acidobacteria bacterium]|nr:alginate lyase family protein [Acidobacteriota bacterium]
MFLLDLPKNKTNHYSINRREVFCVIEHAYRSREIADAVSSGRFAITGVELDLGTDVNWLSNPCEKDIEWQIEWHKFYYGLDLAASFSQTGDGKYPHVWEKLVRSFIRQVPAEFASTDVLARRVQNWIYAWQIFTTAKYSENFSPDFERGLLRSIEIQVEYLRENLTPERNHRTLELYALFIAALALPQIDKNGQLIRFAIEQFSENLLIDILPDGAHREQSTHYHCTVLRSFLGAKENARRFGLKFSPEFDHRLIKACEFAMHIHRPDGEIPAFSDSDRGSYHDLLKLAGNIFSRPDFIYAATTGGEGTAPISSNVSFNNSGYFIQRSGWGTGETSFANEKFLMFDCGPIGDGGHGHYDLLNIEIAASGKPLIVDNGRFTYAEDEDFNWRHFFKGTAAHSTVTVDGKDQTTYRRGKPKCGIAQGKFLERVSRTDLDVVCGKAVSPNYEAIHTRRIFFIRNKYWLIFDELKGEISHRYDLRFHLTPAAWNHVGIFKMRTNAVVRTPDLALIFEKDSEINVEPGWFSPQYGIKKRSPCVSVSTEAASVEFFTLVVPLNLEEKVPAFAVTRNGSSTTVSISPDNSRTEMLSWNLHDERLEDLKLA